MYDRINFFSFKNMKSLINKSVSQKNVYYDQQVATTSIDTSGALINQYLKFNGTAAVWADIVSQFNLNQVYYVDAVTGDDGTATGKPDKPYQTITGCLSAAVSNSVIYINSGTYNESLTISNNYLIISNNSLNVNLTTINGNITFTNTCTLFGMKGITIDSTSDNTVTVIYNTNMNTTLSIQECKLISASGIDTINYNGGIQGLIQYDNCFISDFSRTLANGGGCVIKYTKTSPDPIADGGISIEHKDHVFIVAGYNKLASSVSPPINHAGGVLSIAGVIILETATGIDALQSTCLSSDGILIMIGLNTFSFLDLQLHKINKTGDCPFLLTNCTRNSQIDVLNGFQITDNGYSIGLSLGDLRDKLQLNKIDNSTASTNQVITFDGTNNIWQTPSGGGSYTTGDIKYSVQNTDHGDWLLCDGRAVSRTTYSTLFAVIAVTFGPGDGSTTFNIPDSRGRAIAGISGSHIAGQSLGNETVTLTTNELPAHAHTINITDLGHTHTATSTQGTHTHTATTTSTQGNHLHNYTQTTQGAVGGTPNVGGSQFIQNLSFGSTTTTSVSAGPITSTTTVTSGSAGAITTSNSNDTTGITATATNTGSGQSFSVMNPTLYIGNVFIYAL